MGQRNMFRVLVPVLVMLTGLLALFMLRPVPVSTSILVGNVTDFPPDSATPLQLPASFFDTTHLPDGNIVDLSDMSFPQRTIEAAKAQWNRRT
jgi:hypothetical protein